MKEKYNSTLLLDHKNLSIYMWVTIVLICTFSKVKKIFIQSEMTFEQLLKKY